MDPDSGRPAKQARTSMPSNLTLQEFCRCTIDEDSESLFDSIEQISLCNNDDVFEEHASKILDTIRKCKNAKRFDMFDFETEFGGSESMGVNMILTALSECKKLETIQTDAWFDDPISGDALIRVLTACPNLTDLMFNNFNVSEDTLAKLTERTDLPKLQTIILHEVEEPFSKNVSLLLDCFPSIKTFRYYQEADECDCETIVMCSNIREFFLCKTMKESMESLDLVLRGTLIFSEAATLVEGLTTMERLKELTMEFEDVNYDKNYRSYINFVSAFFSNLKISAFRHLQEIRFILHEQEGRNKDKKYRKLIHAVRIMASFLDIRGVGALKRVTFEACPALYEYDQRTKDMLENALLNSKQKFTIDWAEGEIKIGE